MGLLGGQLMLVGAMSVWMRPLWVVGVGFVAALAILFALLYILARLAPKVSAIARTTAKEAMSQPLFYVLLIIGLLALLIFPFLPYNTFGEDVKMVKSEGLTLIKILAVILAVWTASVSIAEEIEGRTALTLLSKPIGRRQLIIGKFLGIVIPVAVIFILLGAFFLATVSYKISYDSRESAKPVPTVAECRAEVIQVAPGLALGFMEAIILASVSVAISTRLPMMPNMIICFSIYVLGHLVPLLVNSAVGNNDFVQFAGDFSAAVLPVLDHFNMETAISTGQIITSAYLGWAALYTAVYCLVAMLLALLLFEDRDLA
jgi:ABC-type transport system involved in multi-copper enzyme maturation permease subunit